MKCKLDTRWQPNKVGHPARTAAYFDIADIFARACANEPVADALIEFEGLPLSNDPAANRQMDDALDGTILHDLVALARQELAQAGAEPDDEDIEVESEVDEDDQDDMHPRHSDSGENEGDEDGTDGTEDEGDDPSEEEVCSASLIVCCAL